jgi:hypothetical protein
MVLPTTQTRSLASTSAAQATSSTSRASRPGLASSCLGRRPWRTRRRKLQVGPEEGRWSLVGAGAPQPVVQRSCSHAGWCDRGSLADHTCQTLARACNPLPHPMPTPHTHAHTRSAPAGRPPQRRRGQGLWGGAQGQVTRARRRARADASLPGGRPTSHPLYIHVPLSSCFPLSLSLPPPSPLSCLFLFSSRVPDSLASSKPSCDGLAAAVGLPVPYISDR